MSYVDAAYAISLSVLALYGLSVVSRRRRLWRAWERRVAPSGTAEPTAVTAAVTAATARASAAAAPGAAAATSSVVAPADPADR